MSKPVRLSGTWKRGSSWTIGATRRTKDPSGSLSLVDMTGLTTRAMFRVGDENGEVKFTLSDGDGIVIDDSTSGFISLKISRSNSALFAAGDKVFFDIEQTSSADPDFEFQSLTYTFQVIEQVTRDD